MTGVGDGVVGGWVGGVTGIGSLGVSLDPPPLPHAASTIVEDTTTHRTAKLNPFGFMNHSSA